MSEAIFSRSPLHEYTILVIPTHLQHEVQQTNITIYDVRAIAGEIIALHSWGEVEGN